MDLYVLCVACLCAMFLGVVVILLLNVMEVLNMGGGPLLVDRVCVWCANDPSVHLDVPFIGLFVYVGSYLLI